MDIMELLKSIGGGELTEESKQEIQTVFENIVNDKANSIVEEKVKEAVQSAVEKALLEQDESHATQLEKLLSTIDEDHSAKLTKLVQKLDEDHSAKLQDVIKHYEQVISEDAKQLSKALSVDISNFLDLTLDEVLPKEMLKEAVENTRAQEMVEKIKEIVSVDPEYINENIKEALIDGKNQIQKLKEDLNEVLKENVKLSTERNKFEANLLLEQKTKSLSAEKRNFITEQLKNKPAEYVKENFNLALKMFEKKQEEDAKKEKDFIINESLAKTVDTPKVRSAEKEKPHSYVEGYVSGLK